MTPREPDRFDAQAEALVDRMNAGLEGYDQEAIAAVLRAAESSALERAAQWVRSNFSAGDEWAADMLRALIPPAAAPAADGPLDKMKRALDEKVRMERERYASFCEAVAAGSAEDRAIAMAAPATETGKAPTPSLRKECGDNSPEWWTGRWRDWHRGHGCGKDDGQPCTPEGVAEFAAHGRLPGRVAQTEGEGKK